MPAAPTSRRVVNTTSVSGPLGTPGQTNYGAAKAGVAALTTILALEAARYGVRVNAVCPSGTHAHDRLVTRHGRARAGAPPAEGFDVYAPHHPAPVVAHLASVRVRGHRGVFMVKGGDLRPIVPSAADAVDGQRARRPAAVEDVARFIRDVPDVPVSP